MKAVETSKETGLAGIEQTCNIFNLHRDSYYKFQKRSAHRKSVESQVIGLVREERKEQPRVGGRKLLEALQEEFNAAGLKVGRDVLFDILREHDMLVKRKKSSCKTTDSYHRLFATNVSPSDSVIIYRIHRSLPGETTHRNISSNRRYTRSH